MNCPVLISMARGRSVAALATLALATATLPACGDDGEGEEIFSEEFDADIAIPDGDDSSPDVLPVDDDPVNRDAAEDDDDSTILPGDACKPGERSCSSDEVTWCSPEGVWVAQHACDHGCDHGVCLDAPPSCEEGETRCFGEGVLELCESGEWSTLSYCRFDCIDDPEPRCVHCDPDNSAYCDGDVLQRCDPASGLNATTSCHFGCSDGACNPKPDTVLRVENATNYDMVRINLNGVEQFSYPNGIYAGQFIEFTFNGTGTVDYELEVGFYNGDTTRNVYFWNRGSTTLTEGETTIVRFDNPTVGQLLASFDRKEYVGYQYSPLVIHRYVFYADGRWDYYRGGLKQESGRVQLVSWDTYASVVQFKLCAKCETTQFLYPWGSFFQRDGSGIWPIVEYFSD